MATERIANLAASNSLLSYVLRIQSRVHDQEVQVASEKRSQDYAGISRDSQYLVNIENTRDALERYTHNNATMEFRLQSASTAIEGARKTVNDFRTLLVTFSSQDGTKNEQQVRDIQDRAFSSLKALQGYLNTEVNGRFLFSGSRVTTDPVSLGLSTLSAFQTTYDGATVTYPTTRDAHIENSVISKDSAETTSWLTFERDNAGAVSRITSTSGQFANIAVGSKITVSDTVNNNGTFTVSAVTANTIDVVTEMLTDEAANAAATLTKADETILTNLEIGSLAFNRAGDTITAATAGSLAGITAGQVFTIAGSASNNGTYTVDSIDGTNSIITIKKKYMTDEGTAGAPYLAVTSGVNEITFTDNAPNKDTIVSAPARFGTLTAGMKVAITGATAGGNNVTFTINSVSTDGSTLTVDENVTAAAPDGNAVTFTTQQAKGTITATPYYQGDSINPTHRVDSTRDFSYDINGANPAFEKAIRAMSIIAEGAYGTEGGLDQNASRVSAAIYLLNSSLKSAVAGTPPFGTELTNNFEQVQTDLGFQQILVNQTNTSHESLMGFFDKRIADVENVDQLEVISRLLDDSRALEASYQALARIRQLSLSNFL
jgi:flagellar hook-associated protein 3 FlgL